MGALFFVFMSLLPFTIHINILNDILNILLYNRKHVFINST